MWLSIIGMYNYNEHIFDGFDSPSFLDDKNKVHTIDRDDIINNILLECGELELVYTSFEIMRLAISVWSASNQRTWEKLYKSMYLEYNPLWNVDADISINRGGDSENTETVAGYNSEKWSNANKNNAEYGETITERRTGNIGVTASQDLIKKEREIAEFNMIEYITDSFKKRFCLLIY